MSDKPAKEMYSDGVDGVRTTRMLKRALKQRWPIPEEYKEAIMKRQAKIAIDSKSSPREAAAAARTIISADRLNQEEEKEEQPQQHLHLHNHQPAVNLDKLTDEELDKLEQLLLAANSRTTAVGISAGVAGKTAPV